MTKKSLGQYWLNDRGFLDEVAFSAKVEGVDLCLEIGPGTGKLTSSLLRVFDYVTAVEFDDELAKNLPNSFPGKNLTVINQDFLDFDFASLGSPYSVAGNIPYYISSPIILKLILAKPAPQKISLLLQREFAEKIAAEKSALALTVKNRADISLGSIVKKELFTPIPKVDSRILVLTPHSPQVSNEVISFLRQGYSNPRKKLIKNLPYNNDFLKSTF
ncbi:MAG: 16S rRNA (adenine(1518)-N(6)/adenine(1519)-N(6))-dimethyltransferase RsmA, partial [Candidatus Saccharibacteria bacterium]|nr:16S rRNA (adenine(1518)-N(6)/adenine(1519)-N(6))-dimethyltransferase RsmA [Candidatus Saccharibacteria bacterium]